MSVRETAGNVLARVASRPLWAWLAIYAAGVYIVVESTLSVPAGSALVAALLVAMALLHRSGRHRLLIACVFAAALALGMARGEGSVRSYLAGKELLGSIGEGKTRIVVRIDEISERKEGYALAWATVLLARINGQWAPVGAMTRMTVGDDLAGARPGDAFLALARLKAPENFRNPGGFDYVSYLRRKGVAFRTYVGGRDDMLPVIEHRVPGPGAAIEGARSRHIAWLSGFGGDGSRLLRALLAGDKAALEQDTLDAFADTGLAHLLSISGLHVGLVAAAFFTLFMRLFRLSPRLMERIALQRAAALATVAPVVLYALFSGFRVPTQRALVMTVTFLLALAMDRRVDHKNTLALAAGIILFVWPPALFEISFQLSFAAVLGVMYLGPRLAMLGRDRSSAERELDAMAFVLAGGRARVFEELRRYLAGILGVSLAAQWAIFGFLCNSFHQFNPLTPVFNLMAIPVVGLVLLPFGLLASAAALVYEPLGAALLVPALWVADFLSFAIAEWSARTNSVVPLPSLSIVGIVAWYAGGALVIESAIAIRARAWSWDILAKRRLPDFMRDGDDDRPLPVGPEKRSLVFASLGGLLLLALAAGDLFRDRDPFPEGAAVLSAIDVGQGQSLLFRGPRGSRMLIDGGGFARSDFDLGRSVVSPCLSELGAGRLDAVVASHGHPDHCKGLYYILRRRRVGEFWRPPGDDYHLRRLEELARKRGIAVRTLDATAAPFNFGDLEVRVLNPPGPGGPRFEGNNESLALMLSWDGGRAFLTGDMESEAEEMAAGLWRDHAGGEHRGIDYRVTMMSAPHHGSRTSSGLDFLEAFSPGAAVVSAAGPDFMGLPAMDVMERYDRLGILVVRTDRDGFCALATEGVTVVPWAMPGDGGNGGVPAPARSPAR